MIEPQGVPRPLPADGVRELAEHAQLGTGKEFRDRRLTDPEVGGDLMMRPAEHGEFHRAEIACANPRARFVAPVPAPATATARRGAHRALFATRVTR